MSLQDGIPPVGDGSGIERSGQFFLEELQLSLRNRAIPLEALAYDVTPVGMHYTLTHFDVPVVDASAWRLEVGGEVRNPLSISLAELQRRPARTLRVTFECAGDGRALLHPRPISQPWIYGGVGTAEWTGTPLAGILEEAGLLPAASTLTFTAIDRGIEGGVEQDYAWGFSRAVVLSPDVLVVWSMNGRPLEPQHGFPVRLVVPGWYGMGNVKWLRSIQASALSFDGYQQSVAYRYSQSRQESGDPVTLMRVRSLMVPPGIPDFLTRTRIVRRGSVELQGRAWSGRGAITTVDISSDGGVTWSAAEVDAAEHPRAWQSWRYRWDATEPGVYELCCRATDAGGETQPSEPYWTARGMGNNSIHRVRVVVE